MPLTFLVPAFLAGLAALAVPVILHLTRKQSERAVEFPSLMFIQRIPHHSVRRRRVRHWLLLALRCLALAVIVAAFARPFLSRREAEAALPMGGREVVILLDRSYSMGYGDHWQRAVRAAASAIEGLGPRDRASLVLFDDQAEVAARPTSDHALLRGALDAARVRSGVTRYAPALKLAESTLAASPLPRRELVLVSDFQKAGWEGTAGVRLPAGTVVRTLPVGAEAAGNVAVTGVTFQREAQNGRERVTATARLVNRGSAPVAALPVALELGGRPIETRTLALAPNSAATVTFAPFTLAEPGTRGTVRAGQDALAADNAFHFVASPGEALGVLVLEGPGTRADASLYLQRALAIGEQPGFQVEVRRVGQLDPAMLAGTSVVILNDAPFPAGETGRRLRSFVERGGGLVALLGPSGALGWNGAGDDLLPGTVGNTVDGSATGGTALGQIDYSHPVFEPFRTPRGGDFTAARFFAYRPLTAAPGARVLARFGDGGVALAERQVGQGRVLAWGSMLDNAWNDLALQPVFLPFAHQLVKYASGHTAPRAWATAGEVLDPRPAAGAAPTLAITPAGERLPLQAGTPLALREQGFYELRGGRSGETLQRAVAVNLDAAESDLTALDAGEVATALRAASGASRAAGPAFSLSLPERERQQAIWWYLLIGASLLLAAETVLSNRLSRAAR